MSKAIASIIFAVLFACVSMSVNLSFLYLQKVLYKVGSAILW